MYWILPVFVSDISSALGLGHAFLFISIHSQGESSHICKEYLYLTTSVFLSDICSALGCGHTFLFISIHSRGVSSHICREYPTTSVFVSDICSALGLGHAFLVISIHSQGISSHICREYLTTSEFSCLHVALFAHLRALWGWTKPCLNVFSMTYDLQSWLGSHSHLLTPNLSICVCIDADTFYCLWERKKKERLNINLHNQYSYKKLLYLNSRRVMERTEWKRSTPAGTQEEKQAVHSDISPWT